MSRKSNPKRELMRLKDQKERLKGEIAEVEKRLHLRLGRLACEAGADALPEDSLKAILSIAVERGAVETLEALRTNSGKAPTQKTPLEGAATEKLGPQ